MYQIEQIVNKHLDMHPIEGDLLPMTYITREDSIELLSFSNRTYNCLRRNGIDTIGQVLDFPAEEWKKLPNLGAKSVSELLGVLEEIRTGSSRFSLVACRGLPTATELVPTASQPEKSQEEQFSECIKNIQHYPPESAPVRIAAQLDKLYVERMGLNVRAVNSLKNGEIYTGLQLVQAAPEELRNLRNMGAKTIESVLEKRSELLQELECAFQVESHLPPQPAVNGTDGPGANDDVDAESPLHQFLLDLAQFTGLQPGFLWKEAIICRSENPEAVDQELISCLWQREYIRTTSCQAILRLVDGHQFGISTPAILSAMPTYTSGDVLDGLLSELESQDRIRIQGDLVQRRLPTAMEFAQNISDERTKDFLLSKLRGETLDEIGRRYEISRERVRQIIKRALSRRPVLMEDRYLALYDRYEFSYEEFHLAFDEPRETYNYLDMIRTTKGERKPIRDILTDDSIPENYRRKAERAIYRQYVTIDGVRIKKQRPELARYVVQTYCRELTTMEEFLQWYQLLLETIGASEDPSLALEVRTYENKLSISNDVLWNHGHRFRYYPISQYDCSHLLETLALDQYEDMEFSSLKLFREAPDLMEEYDIRDEYELHNLLKKIWPSTSTLNIQFKKMPTIVIGTPNRDRQVLDLLMEYAPISNVDLAKKYEERYGTRWDTALGSYFSCIDQFFHNGMYRVDQPVLPENQHQRLAQLLTDDLYATTEIKRIYLREFPNGDSSLINVFNLKHLGFRVYTGYVVSDRFANASNYFHSLLTAQDLVDMRPIVKKGGELAGNAFWKELTDLKARREIVEYLPNQYINIRRLNANGVAISDLENYCTSVAALVHPGDYFTITSLQKDGFSHPLDETGFDNWFFASVLAEDHSHFFVRRMGKTKLFYRGHKMFSLLDFLRWLLEPTGKMDIFELYELLEQQYGLLIDRSKILETIRTSDLYYDSIMEAAYIDYDTYFEEV